jgi:2-C-methyl-D-erythritol 4-phosphate cytidylyltransferase/2-C-methyl-D-erythritol 2,4-cyclodiphosphate synthase
MAYSPAMAKAQDIGALVVAAGQGARVGGPVPKQFRPIGGQSMLAHSLATFLRHDRIASALAVIGAGHEAAYAEAAPKDDRLREPVKGGINRQQSVLSGLRSLARDDPPAYVLIHDAARPSPARSSGSPEAASSRPNQGMAWRRPRHPKVSPSTRFWRPTRKRRAPASL